VPQPRTSRFDAEQRVPHNPIRRVDIENGSGTTIQRDVPILPSGMVTADRNAAQQLVREVDIPLGVLTDAAKAALTTGVADTYIRSWAGIRYTDTEMLGGVHNSVASWTPTSTGQMVGVTVNGSGELQLGP